MANTKEIKSRIHSVQDTMKITKAMHMISSAKLKKAKKEMRDSQSHFNALQKSIAKIFRNNFQAKKIFLFFRIIRII